MEKPFDSKDLIEKLKAQGLPVTEQLVEAVAQVLFQWTEESLIIHPNPYVKFAIPVLVQVKAMAMTEINKIDGQPG